MFLSSVMCGFQTTNQQRAFEHCAKEYTDEFLNGYNATIMAFGQVGAGKTYTMAGDTKVTLGIERILSNICRAG